MAMTLTVHEVAQLAGVSPDTVRRLERSGVIRAQRDGINWRRFSPEVVTVLRRRYGKDVQAADEIPA